MGAHSIPNFDRDPVFDLNKARDVSLTLEERGYLKEMILTYKNMFSEQMTSMKFGRSTDMQKAEAYREKQLFYASCIMEKLKLADSD